MHLVWLELRAAARRRLRNPLAPFFEGAVAGGLLLLIERVLPPGAEGRTAAQVMFIASLLALPALQGLHRLISEEGASGTLETLLQVPAGPIKAFLARDIASMLSIALTLPSLFAVLHAFSEVAPSAFARYALPIVAMRAGLTGMGISLGSVTLLTRRTGAVVNAMSIIMVVTSLGAGYGRGLLAFLAGLSPQGYMAMGIYSGRDPAGMLPGIALLSAVWIATGFALYNLAVRRARKFGLLINY